MQVPFQILILTDWAHPNLLGYLDSLLIPGVAVQHRHHGVSDRIFWSEAASLSALCRAKNVPLFINSRLDVALALEAHLHLSSHGLSYGVLKPFVPKTMWLSASVHHEDEAQAFEGVDIALVCPVFAPRSKPDDSRVPLGPAGFCRLKSKMKAKAFALGGLSLETLQQVPEAQGVAVLQSLYQQSAPLTFVQSLLNHLRST
jgi:thiamine-phosphate pyrophosphorylase